MKTKILILRPSVERPEGLTVTLLGEALDEGFTVIRADVCEDRIVYILEKLEKEKMVSN